MKNTNRTGRQKYFSADRKCKDCVYNVGKRKEKQMKTVQIYNLHLVTGEVIQAAEDYELEGKKTIISLFQRADDEDIFLITDLLLGSCYVPKKNIAYIATGDVRVDAEPDKFETNTCLLRRVKKRGSKD